MQRKRRPVGGTDPNSGAAAPQALPQSGAEPHGRPTVPVLRKRPPPPQSRADLEGPKKRRVGPTAAPDLWVRPRNGSGDPQDVVGSDVGCPDPKEGAQRDPERDPKRTGNEHPEAQQEQLPHPKTHRETPKVARGCGAEGAAPQRGPREGCGADGSDAEEGGEDPDAERPQILHTAPNGPKTETPNPDPKGPQSGGRHSLEVDSDTDIEEEELNPDVPHVRKQRAPHMTPKGPPVVMETPNADPKGPQIVGYQNLEADGDTDIEGEELNPDVPHLRDHTSPQSAPKCPTVVMETPNPDPKGSRSGAQDLEVDSDTDVEGELNPDVPHPENQLRNHRTPHMTPKEPTLVMETPSPDPKGPRSGGHQDLEVGSDTDNEGEELNPDVPHARNQRTPHTTPKEPTVVMETPSPDPKGPQIVGYQNLEVDSDTDIEGEELNPDVSLPKKHLRDQRMTHMTPKEPAVGMETPNTDPKGLQSGGYHSLEVDSDTDVEEELNPDVPHIRNRRMPHMTPKDLTVVMETPNADPKGPQSRAQNLQVDSDTDIEGEELNPDVPHLRDQRTPHMTPRDPASVMETPSPEPKGLQSEYQDPEVGSDTDVEGEELNPDVLHPENPLRDQRSPHMTPKEPTVVMETPNADPKGPQSGGHHILEVDSDTDVEEELNPDVPHLENHLRDHTSPHITPKCPTVVTETPNPDPKGPQSEDHSLEVGSDTDIEGDQLNPNVTHPENHPRDQRSPHMTPKDPPVGMETPSPDPKGPRSGAHQDPEVGSDAEGSSDAEEVFPTPHVRILRSRIPPQNSAVGSTAMGGSATVGHADPKGAKPTPKGQRSPLDPRADGGVGRAGLEEPDPIPGMGDDPEPHSRAEQRDVDAPKTPKAPTPNERLAAGGQHRPHGDTDGDTEEEDDAELFLAPTQSFLPPTEAFLPPTETFLPPTQSFLPPPAQGAVPTDTAPEWDPEEPTQCFCRPEEEEEEEEPPRRRVAAVTAPHGDPGTVTARSEDVGEGQRRSQRRACSRGGGASRAGGGAKAKEGGATPDPAPLRRSPRLLARPPPEKGRSHDEPRPPPAPRPRRGHAPSQKKPQEEEPADITRPQLRPRGGSASSALKVLFTGVVASPEMEVALRSLGGSVAASVFDCTHLVTDRVRRTVKFLCAVARGIAIVTPTWIHESARSGRVLPPGPFLVRDGAQERHFGFSLSHALGRARRRPLLQGYEVHVTPGVRPEPEQMRDIITCSGGTFLPSMPCTYGPRRLVISCPEDAGRWGPALGVHIPLLSAELLLTGLLRQQLQPHSFLLTPPGPPQDPPVSPRRLRDRTRRDPPGTQRCGRRGVK